MVGVEVGGVAVRSPTDGGVDGFLALTGGGPLRCATAPGGMRRDGVWVETLRDPAGLEVGIECHRGYGLNAIEVPDSKEVVSVEAERAGRPPEQVFQEGGEDGRAASQVPDLWVDLGGRPSNVYVGAVGHRESGSVGSERGHGSRRQ